MNVKSLLKQSDLQKIIEELSMLYPDEKARIQSGYYQNLIQSIVHSEGKPNEDQMTVHVEYSKDFGETNPDFIWNASYSTHKRYKHKYALKFASIEEIASSYVYEKDLKKQHPEEYLAHLLFEISHGDIVVSEDEFWCVDKTKRTMVEKKEFFSLEDVINQSDEELE